MKAALPIACVALAGAAASASALAAQRTYVASYGSDLQTCTLASPCRGFERAISRTDSGGEVVVLDSAGYGTANITQSVSLIAPPGVHAAITVPAGSGITVNGNGIEVTLRGLTISGTGGTRGIRVLQAAALHVERNIITGLAGAGIEVGAPAAVVVKDSLVRDNSGKGIDLQNAASGSTLRVDNSHIERNGSYGISVETTAKVSIRDSTIADNVGTGLKTRAGAAETIVLDVVRALVRGNNGTGIEVGATAVLGYATASITDSVINDNGGSGVSAYSSNGGHTYLAADRNAMVGNTFSGLASCDAQTMVIASGNVAMRNQEGFTRACGAGGLKSLGNNLVEENGIDTQGGPPLIVPGK